MAGLSPILQQDFSAGMFQSVAPERIPPNGVADIVNGILDEDGSINKRGGASLVVTGAPAPLTWIWSGYLGNSAVTLAATSSAWLRTSGSSFISVGGSGRSGPSGRQAVLGSVIYLPGGVTIDSSFTLGTAAKSAPYYAAVAGRLLAGNGRRIDFSTLSHQGTGTLSVGSSTVASVVNTSGAFQAGQVINGAGIPVGTTILSVGAGTLTLSANATTAGTAVPLAATGGLPRYDATDYHEMPEGAQILGIEGLRDQAAVFTTDGVFLISGLSLNLTDDSGNVQQRIDRYAREMILWGDAGIAGWEGGLLVPARDGVWLVSLGIASEAPQAYTLISRPIADLYKSYVAAGCTPGGAMVYRGTYKLPILQNGSCIDVLTCRLDVPARPWSRMSGKSAVPVGLSRSRVSGRAFAAVGSDILSLSWLDPLTSNTEQDGSAIDFRVRTRDFSTGPGTMNTVLKLRGYYELEAPDGANTTTISDDFSDADLTALNGKAADTGGSWASSGAATDFTVVAARGAVGRSAQDERFAVIGSNVDSVDARATVSTDGYNGTVIGRLAVVARYVDANNHYRAELAPSGYQLLLRLYRRLAGVDSLLGTGAIVSSDVMPLLLAGTEPTIELACSVTLAGLVTATLRSSSGGATLAAVPVTDAVNGVVGGALGSGKVGIMHSRSNTQPAVEWYVGNFTSLTPGAAPAVGLSASVLDGPTTRAQVVTSLGEAPANVVTGLEPEPFNWSVIKKLRVARFDLECTDQVRVLSLRGLELFVRSSGRQ